jgi:hypothetical protein
MRSRSRRCVGCSWRWGWPVGSRRIHIGISVRGVLRQPLRQIWREWKGAVTDDEGNPLPDAESIRDAFMNELAKGHEVIPFGEPCEGWDYRTGCPGHDIADPDVARG